MTRPLRGSSTGSRPLSAITLALDAARNAALARALDPRNAQKGDWHRMTDTEVRALLIEELGELLAALEHEPLDRIASEAGDVVWSVAIALDRENRRNLDRLHESRRK